MWADLYLSRDTDFSKPAHEIVIYFNGAARTWARKFPYEKLAQRIEAGAAKTVRNREKGARRKANGR